MLVSRSGSRVAATASLRVDRGRGTAAGKTRRFAYLEESIGSVVPGATPMRCHSMCQILQKPAVYLSLRCARAGDGTDFAVCQISQVLKS